MSSSRPNSGTRFAQPSPIGAVPCGVSRAAGRTWLGGLSLLLVVAFSVQALDAATLQPSESARQSERATSIEASRRFAVAVRRQREHPAAALRLTLGRVRFAVDGIGSGSGIDRGLPTDRMAIADLALPPPFGALRG